MERSDYFDPACPFDASAFLPPEQKDSVAERMELQPTLARYDALMASGRMDEAAQLLCQALEKARAMRDRRTELTILSEQMGCYRQAGKERQALEAAEAGLSLLAELALRDEIAAGTIRLNAATVYTAFGRHQQALRQFEDAFRCYNRRLSPEDPRYAGLLNNMAGAYAAAGDFAQAEAYYNKALDVLPEDARADRAVTHMNLAQLYRMRDPQADEAIGRALRDALDLLDHPLTLWDTYYAHTCRKLAPAFAAFGQEEIARDLIGRAEDLEGA